MVDVYVEQNGFTESAVILVNDDPDTPQPTRHKYIPPKYRGPTVSGIPKYQGPAGMILEYEDMTIDEFQFFSAAFFPGLNSGEGPAVTVYWPNPYEAGRFVTSDGVLLWPEYGSWEMGLMKSCVMTITRLVQREG